MRAFILRRVGLIEEGGAGSVLVGRPGAPDLVRLQGFLARNGYPYRVLDAVGRRGRPRRVERLGVLPEELPLMVCPNGAVLKRPTDAEAGVCLGITPDLDPETVYDVAVVGAGPAGLAAAVYAASEGLSVLVLDQRAFGGQAGASARIENYLGFPTGISGQALAGRAFSQAMKFGAEIAIPLEVARLDCDCRRRAGDPLRLELTDGRAVGRAPWSSPRARATAGPTSRVLRTSRGAASPTGHRPSRRSCARARTSPLVGGGNSAGQAVVYPRAQGQASAPGRARDGLRTTMSRYLIDRIAALPNVELHIGTRDGRAGGRPKAGLTAAVFRERAERSHEDLRAAPSVPVHRRRSQRRLARRGRRGRRQGLRPDGPRRCRRRRRAAAPRCRSRPAVPGVFAIGDVRAGSTKRVAAAVGEGAAVVAQIHQALARQPEHV